MESNPHYNYALRHIILKDPPHPKCTTIITDLNGYKWSASEDLVKQGYFKPVTVPKEQGVNTNLLLLFNCTMGSAGERFTTQIVESMAHDIWFQKYGRIKVLIAARDVTRNRFMPRMARFKNRMSILAETFATVREIAGTKLDMHHVNLHAAAIEKRRKLAEAGKPLKPVKAPPHRATVAELRRSGVKNVFAKDKELLKMNELLRKQEDEAIAEACTNPESLFEESDLAYTPSSSQSVSDYEEGLLDEGDGRLETAWTLQKEPPLLLTDDQLFPITVGSLDCRVAIFCSCRYRRDSVSWSSPR